jgi:hypothetical protein
MTSRLPRTVRCLPLFAALGVVAAHAGTGTVPTYGLGTQTTQYVQSGSPQTGVDWPLELRPIAHLRTYFFDAESASGSQSEAWALGGWAGLTTGWMGDIVQIGAVGYTSQRLYGPDDKGGTKLLAPPQEPITVLGEAFGAVRILDQTFVGYRQLVNRPFVNVYDTRMVPQVMEGYTLRGAPGGVSYLAGYLTKIKVRDSQSYVWFSQQAGAASQEGMALAGATIPVGKDGFVRVDDQYVKNTFNTFYVDTLIPFPWSDDATLAVGAQYYPQTSVGSNELGDFSTWGAGFTLLATWRDLTAQLAYTQTGKGYATQSPWGDHPSYANLMQVAFNSAGEKAVVAGITADLGKHLAPGLSAGAVYAHGWDRVGLADRNETDVRVDYAFPFPATHVLHGLSATFRYSWLRQDGSPTATQLRAYINYEVPFR